MRVSRTNKRFGFLAPLVACATLCMASASPTVAAPPYNPADPPVLKLHSLSNPAAAPGSQIRYVVDLNNIGGSDTPLSGTDPVNSKYTIRATLPPGLIAVSSSFSGGGWSCAVPPVSITCTNTGGPQQNRNIDAHTNLELIFTVAVAPDAAGKTLTTSFEAWGGGAVLPGGGACANSATPPPGLPACAATLDATRIADDPPAFGIGEFDGQLSADVAGAAFTQAGGHPYELTTAVEFNSFDHPNPAFGVLTPVEPTKDVFTELPPGLVGNPAIVGQCSASDVLEPDGGIESKPLCSPSSQVGTVTVRLNGTGSGTSVFEPIPLFNLEPPSGTPARFGFAFLGTLTVIDTKLRSGGDYGFTAVVRNISQGLPVQGAEFHFWGVPGAAAHDAERGCPGEPTVASGGSGCPANTTPTPFLRLPTKCSSAGQGLPWTVKTDSWDHPGSYLPDGDPDLSDPNWKQASFVSHNPPAYPAAPDEWGSPKGPDGCDGVPVKGKLSAQPTALDTETSSGLAVHVEVPSPGLETADGIGSSDLKNVKVALPQGVTINPSQAEGLGVCSPAQYESTELSYFPTPGKGCPDDSKIGTVKVVTPLLEEALPGDVFIARQDDPTTSTPGAENPFDSLLAIYVVIEEPERGILVKLPGEVRTNEKTGQIETEFSNLPQIPFSTFDFKFREGARAPLVTPATCGTYETVAEITGWSDPANPIVSKSRFEIVHGIGGGPCPSGEVPPFKPGFSAGSINNNAGSFSPFNMRLTRLDGEQDMTRFSAVLPPGVLGKLAGVSKCPESAIAIAKSKTGLEERANPSCPANSQIGRSLVGAGVGSVLTYIPGKIYLGGPEGNNPLSVIAITPAVAGPFDVGTVVVREALTLNPKTAEVEVDGAASDPIPHMLKGIPAKLRDLRVYVDRPEFTLNPTSCDPSSTKATLFGGFADAFSSADDVPVSLSDRFQAANCAALGFKPKLGLKLKGGTRRGDFPALQAAYRPRPGDANVESMVVRLPRSAFLEQGHIRTICTRVQFAADACPKGAQYGFIRAWTPLLEEPLRGPVWLRSSNHKLPDLVFDLHGLVDVEVATRIDSIKGGVRARVEAVPDAPLSKVLLRMQGGKKGLIVNSRNLCRSASRANVQSDGHNGKISDFRPALKPKCSGSGERKK